MHVCAHAMRVRRRFLRADGENIVKYLKYSRGSESMRTE